MEPSSGKEEGSKSKYESFNCPTGLGRVGLNRRQIWFVKRKSRCTREEMFSSNEGIFARKFLGGCGRDLEEEEEEKSGHGISMSRIRQGRAGKGRLKYFLLSDPSRSVSSRLFFF